MYPCLRPYRKSKLDCKFSPHIFLGYPISREDSNDFETYMENPLHILNRVNPYLDLTQEDLPESSGSDGPPSTDHDDPEVFNEISINDQDDTAIIIPTDSATVIPRMGTRRQTGIVKPNSCYALSISVTPMTAPKVLVDEEEFDNVINSLWIFKVKQRPDSSIERLKARLVAN